MSATEPQQETLEIIDELPFRQSIRNTPFLAKVAAAALTVLSFVAISYGIGSIITYFKTFGLLAVFMAGFGFYSAWALLFLRESQSPRLAAICLILFANAWLPISTMLPLPVSMNILVGGSLFAIGTGLFLCIMESAAIREWYGFTDGEEAGKPFIPVTQDPYVWENDSAAQSKPSTTKEV